MEYRGNLYNHLDDGTTELLTNKNERILIDTEDFEKVREYTWKIVNGTVLANIKGNTIYMHRLVIEGRDIGGIKVNHLNGDTLDNRKDNISRRNKYTHLDGNVTEFTIGDSIVYIDTEEYDSVVKHTWCLNTPGYATSYIDGKRVLLHRFIMDRYEDTEGLVIDHIEHNILDNRKEKLRVCTYSQNSMNSVIKINNTSGVVGVSYTKNIDKYKAYISVDGVVKNLGYTKTIEEAIKLRHEAEIKYFGEFIYEKSTTKKQD